MFLFSFHVELLFFAYLVLFFSDLLISLTIAWFLPELPLSIDDKIHFSQTSLFLFVSTADNCLLLVGFFLPLPKLDSDTFSLSPRSFCVELLYQMFSFSAAIPNSQSCLKQFCVSLKSVLSYRCCSPDTSLYCFLSRLSRCSQKIGLACIAFTCSITSSFYVL